MSLLGIFDRTLKGRYAEYTPLTAEYMLIPIESRAMIAATWMENLKAVWLIVDCWYEGPIQPEFEEGRVVAN